MLFARDYVGYVFPEEECEELFKKCISIVYKNGNVKSMPGAFAITDLPESMKMVMAKDDYVYGMMTNPWKIRTYMSYTVYYLLSLDSDVVSSDLFIDCVLNTYDDIYDYENYGVYATLWFESRSLTIEFYKAFYEFLLPLLHFYNDNDANRRCDDINFSRQYRTLYRLYREYGLEIGLGGGVLCDTLIGFMNDVDENYERPRKKRSFLVN